VWEDDIPMLSHFIDDKEHDAETEIQLLCMVEQLVAEWYIGGA